MERIVVTGHKIVWSPKTTTEYCNLLTQNAVDTILAVCKQLRSTGQHKDVDLAAEIEGTIKRYSV